MFAPERDDELLRPWLEQLAQTETDPEKIERLLQPEALRTMLSGAIETVAPRAAKDLLRNLKTKAPAMLAERRSTFGGFERRLFRTWRKPLDLLEMLLVIAAEVGETFSREWPSFKVKDKELVFHVLLRLHVRGCQVVHEVLALLKAGHASGAHARWRALHETNVTAMFIAKHGKDTAERYLLHEHIEGYKAALVFQKHRKALGQRGMRTKDIDRMTRVRDQLITQFGKSFNGNYGWAAAALGRTDERVRFSDVEDDVQLDHLRPYYKMASHPVHANPKALTFSLGLRPRQKSLLAGPSNLGLTEPGHSTALSLTQLTITLLVMRPSFDVILASRTLLLLQDEVGQAFLKAHKSLLARARRARVRKTTKQSRGRVSSGHTEPDTRTLG